MLVLAGCGGECETAADCTAKNSCFTAKCEKKLCVQDSLPDCCGNDIKDDIEDGKKGNKCTCPADYGPCSGDVEGSSILKLGCNDDDTECAGTLAKAAQEEKLLTHELSSTVGDIKLVTSLLLPFNVDEDTIHLEISVPEFKASVDDLILTKIEVFGENNKREKVELGEKEVSRVFWDTKTIVEEDIIIQPKLEIIDETLKKFRVKLSFSYMYRGAEKTGAVENDYRTIDFRYVDPGMKPKCPKSCDDDNPATKDSCSVRTDYFCEHTPIRGRCGNYDCEGNEDKCTCPTDCGLCDAKIGDYLEKFCYQRKECVTHVKPEIDVESTTNFEERNLNKFKLIAKYTVNKPFDINKDRANIDFELSFQGEGVSALTILTARLFEGTKLLSEQEVNKVFVQVGDKVVIDLPLDIQMEDEASKSVTLKIWYDYVESDDAGSEVKSGTFSKSLGKIELVNPVVSEE